ncbi:hypothetical protein HYW46_05340 [Candidatus Daviesbacteria bacterium]|nr:hypothetical protein [Candidatus Daviesbacteria bacterium]
MDEDTETDEEPLKDNNEPNQTIEDPPLPLSPKQWKYAFKRLIRRAAISKQLPKQQSLNKIIDEVRRYEEKIGLDKLADALIEEEVTIHPKMAGVANFAFEILSKKYPEIQAVVLLGSSIHGGAMVREASGSIKEPDFDWGIITDKSISDGKAVEIQEELKKYLPYIIRKLGFNETFHLCFAANPLWFRSISVKKQSDLENLLSYGQPLPSDPLPPFSQGKTLDPQQTAVFFLSPSFPPEINQQNREFLFGALRELAQTQREIWKIVVVKIHEEWSFVHGIRHKHFELPREKDQAIAINVVYSFGADNLRAKVMWELLKATGK